MARGYYGHPPACTCVNCVRRRLKMMSRGRQTLLHLGLLLRTAWERVPKRLLVFAVGGFLFVVPYCGLDRLLLLLDILSFSSSVPLPWGELISETLTLPCDEIRDARDSFRSIYGG